jgi:hypothetical protein
MLEKYLEDLEKRIDPFVEEKLFNEWKDFCDGRTTSDIFSPRRENKRPPTIEWPEISINSALDSYELMALQQLKNCSDALRDGKGMLLNVRCNYGTSILPTLFGATLFVMEEKLNTLPTSKPMGVHTIEEIVRKGIPDLSNGLGKRVFEMANRFHGLFDSYPRIKQHVRIFHPDLQGPMDVCELLYGSELFVDLLIQPDLLRHLLNLITETYIAFMKKWELIVPFNDAYSTHWSMLHRGHIMLRDDSAMNLSPEMFDEFVKPYDQRLLSVFGGGAIHFCGRGDHFIESASRMEKLYAIHMSQPELNNLETIFHNTVDKNIRLLSLRREVAEEAVRGGRDLRKSVHCWDS